MEPVERPDTLLKIDSLRATTHCNIVMRAHTTHLLDRIRNDLKLDEAVAICSICNRAIEVTGKSALVHAQVT